uniref:Uncharacterized protein n=2 Tax=viral metagenome TaxID=1070528 RepID=A0A6M3K4I2_9ZZZZ
MSKEPDNEVKKAYIPQIQDNVTEAFTQSYRISRAIHKLKETMTLTTEAAEEASKEPQLTQLEKLESDTENLHEWLSTLADRLDEQLNKLLGAEQ